MADQIVSAAEPNKAAEARPMLRVVLGANQGAEVPLSDGDWLIGTAADSEAEAVLVYLPVEPDLGEWTCNPSFAPLTWPSLLFP